MNVEREMVDVLLVEDNPSDADLAMRALTRGQLTAHITVLSDGAEALAYLFGPDAEGPCRLDPLPKLILLNLHLPKVSGLEVLARLKADPQTRTIPVVMLTSSEEEQDVFRSYQLGVNSYIVKPVDFLSFREAVRQLGDYWLTLNKPPAQKGAGATNDG